MTAKTIPAYLEDERQKDCDAQLRMEAEAARSQPLSHDRHRAAKLPTDSVIHGLKQVPSLNAFTPLRRFSGPLISAALRDTVLPGPEFSTQRFRAAGDRRA